MRLQSGLFREDFMLFVYHLKEVRRRANGLGLAQEQKSFRLKSVVERRQYLPLQVLLDINEEVAATDKVHAREWRVAQKIVPGEDDHLAQEFSDSVAAVRLHKE